MEITHRLEREEHFKWYFESRQQALITDQYETP